MSDVRARALDRLEESISGEQLTIAQRDRRAYVGIGYALLDLAEAVRELKPSLNVARAVRKAVAQTPPDRAQRP